MPSAPLAASLDILAAGARRLADGDPASRAALAERVARSVVAAAGAWAEVAAGIKRAAAEGAALAEEIATGPLGTARLALLHARAWRDIARDGVPRAARAPRLLHAERGPREAWVAVDVLPGACPAGTLHDEAIFAGLRATVRCHDPGGVAAFAGVWRTEAETRPRSGGVAAVLGAGNVTGLGPADVLAQVFGAGRAALLKLHPLHAPLVSVLGEALAPLCDEGLLRIVVGDAGTAREAVNAPATTHVHLTGGRRAFDRIVWGDADPRDPASRPVLEKPITCELGNVTPWFVLPGRYPRRVLEFQADQVAASIANNTSFNCIATKAVVTCRSWEQRGEFMERVRRRLASVPPRPGWFPGSAADWAEASGRSAPHDGTLPWVVETAADAAEQERLLGREWFVPVACEVPIDGDDVEGFCGAALAFSHRLPGSLAASVTVPPRLPSAARVQVESFIDHLAFGTVAVNTWSALGYALGVVPWGGFPGATLRDPRSGIGFVHDPLLLPLVRNSVVRAPARIPLTLAWFPWHRSGEALARGAVALVGRRAGGRSGLGTLLGMLPAVLRG